MAAKSASKAPAVREKYGREFPAEWWDVQVELHCMLLDHKESDGGLGMHGHLRNAMMMLWPQLYAGEVNPGVLRWRDDLELLTWAWCNYRIVSVIGHASAGKTHTFGHIGFTHYLADAPNTILTLTSTHLRGLRSRLWSDVVSAATTSTAGSVCSVRAHDLTMRPLATPKENKYVVEGIAVDRGQEAVEKIQGNHSRNHRLLIVDEAQGTPGAVFEAAANLMTDQDFRMAMLANPTSKYSEFGSWCEPSTGWSKVDPDNDEWWETARGGVCVRLDGMRSANMKHNKVHFPFLIDEKYVDSVEKAYGYNSPRYWIFVRGWFPPDGTLGTVFPSNVLAMAEQKKTYNFRPTPCAALDPAFEGGDECVLQFGEYGEADGSEYAFNLLESFPVTVEVKEGGDPMDYLIARKVIAMCVERGVEPKNFIMDSTGAGRGVAAILQKEWGYDIEKCYFGGKSTDRYLKAGDDRTCHELFDRFVTELWFSARAFMEEGLIGNLTVEFKTLREQLAARNYETVHDKKDAIETKRVMKKRVGYSPDHADAFCMFTELFKRKGAVAGSAQDYKKGGGREALHRRAVAYSQVTHDEDFAHATV